MKNKFIWLVLSLLMVSTMIFASCNTKSTSTTNPATSTTTAASSTTTTTSTTKTTTSTPVQTTTSTTTAGTGNWWDSLGKPTYGGTLTLRFDKNIVNFDTYNGDRLATAEEGWMERLFADDWLVNPAEYSYAGVTFRPNERTKGLLAQTWEFTDPHTFVVHVRQGVRWQNIAPMNGREFVASDIAYHYDRQCGLGMGFNSFISFYKIRANLQFLQSVTATEKYTVVFKWTIDSPELILETLQSTAGAAVDIEAPEAVTQWGNLNDWHHAIGTGPWILSDFVDGSSVTMVRNPNYWGYDERYPQNQLPYMDGVKILIIPDASTALAGLRSGKIDVLEGQSAVTSQSVAKTNPEIKQITIPAGSALSLDTRVDVAPFNDIRVRKAMQMAIDLPTIAKTYYGGTVDPYPAALTSAYMKGWGEPYTEWPQDLKDEYTFNQTAAKKLLSDAGYPNGFKTNMVTDAASDMDLLTIIKGYFSQVGIDMTIRPMDSASYLSYVGAYQHDQISTRPVSSLGLTYEPLTQLSGLSKYSTNSMKIVDPVYDAFYDRAKFATDQTLVKTELKNANEYVARQHWMVSLIHPKLFALYQPWLKGYYGQDNACSAGVGIRLLCFYDARFWIDQNVKKSIGH